MEHFVCACGNQARLITQWASLPVTARQREIFRRNMIALLTDASEDNLQELAKAIQDIH